MKNLLKGLVLDHLVPLAIGETMKKRRDVSHIVCFKFRDDVSPEQIAQTVKGFRRLAKRLSLVQSIKYGINNSPEKLNAGFTHCFVLTFASTTDRDKYLVHPEHTQFSQSIAPLLASDGVLVIDFVDRVI